MSLLDRLLGRTRARRAVDQYFKMLTTYSPKFTRFSGRLFDGAAQPKLQTLLKKRPNEISTWSQFLYRTATILEMQDSVIIVPLFNRSLEVVGIYPVLPSRCRVLQDAKGIYWIEYQFSDK